MNQTIFIKLIYGKGVISVIAVMLMIGCINDVKNEENLDFEL